MAAHQARKNGVTLTPNEFREAVLPRIVNLWETKCLCESAAFRKLLAFDFRDYGTGPVGLADAEILIDAIIRPRFLSTQQPTSHQGEITQRFSCPQCQVSCTELYAEFSISMSCSMVTYDVGKALASTGLYVVGFYGFHQDDFTRIHDFQRAATVDEFLRQFESAP